ncbi:hypothetical protein N9X83_02170, partial [Flavobacteriaceae bacterium]|nr:hypothetical protein [Flavobacteriaceae bacterium]
MNRVIFFFITACILSCSNNTKNTITEDQAISVLKGFFTAMDIDNLGSDLVFDYTTTDFVIYEMGDKYDLESFLEIIKSHFKKGYISTEWSLYDFKVSIDSNTAHISYSNKGKFTFIEDG